MLRVDETAHATRIMRGNVFSIYIYAYVMLKSTSSTHSHQTRSFWTRFQSRQHSSLICFYLWDTCLGGPGSPKTGGLLTDNRTLRWGHSEKNIHPTTWDVRHCCLGPKSGHVWKTPTVKNRPITDLDGSFQIISDFFCVDFSYEATMCFKEVLREETCFRERR